MEKAKFFGHELVDVGSLTGWTDGNKYEAVIGRPGTAQALRFTVVRHDDGKRWVAKLEQTQHDGVSLQLVGDDFAKLVEQCEGRVRDLRTQLEALTAPTP